MASCLGFTWRIFFIHHLFVQHYRPSEDFANVHIKVYTICLCCNSDHYIFDYMLQWIVYVFIVFWWGLLEIVKCRKFFNLAFYLFCSLRIFFVFSLPDLWCILLSISGIAFIKVQFFVCMCLWMCNILIVHFLWQSFWNVDSIFIM